jgi:hypothetical protein
MLRLTPETAVGKASTIGVIVIQATYQVDEVSRKAHGKSEEPFFGRTALNF